MCLGYKAHPFSIVRREVENRSAEPFLTVGVVPHAGAWDVIVMAVGS